MGNIEKFDSIASQYDGAERIKVAKIISDTIRPYLINGKLKTVIDYGCGTGLVGMNLLDDFHSILFIDASANMVEQVKAKIEKSACTTADAICIDLVTACPADLHADYIIVAQTLLHIKEIDLILSRLLSVLNKGGHLLIIDFDKNDQVVSDDVHNGFHQEELISTVKKIGFTKAASKTFYHGKKMFMKQDASLFILDAEK